MSENKVLSREELETRIRNGIPLNREEQQLLYETIDEYECEIVELLSHGWVRFRGIFKLSDNSFYALEYDYLEDYGCEFFEEYALKKVSLKEVTTYEWVED